MEGKCFEKTDTFPPAWSDKAADGSVSLELNDTYLPRRARSVE